MFIVSRIVKILGFICFYLVEMIRSNLRVAYDVLTPAHKMKPAILEIPLDVKTDMEILLFANLMTMTPGTMSFRLSEDKSKLYVHAMYVDDPERQKQEIKEKFENRLLEIFR